MFLLTHLLMKNLALSLNEQTRKHSGSSNVPTRRTSHSSQQCLIIRQHFTNGFALQENILYLNFKNPDPGHHQNRITFLSQLRTCEQSFQQTNTYQHTGELTITLSLLGPITTFTPNLTTRRYR